MFHPALSRLCLLAGLICLQTPASTALATAGQDEHGEVRFGLKQGNGIPGSIRTLRAMQTQLLSGPAEQRLMIMGHADDGGDATFNLELSKRRVRGVARWLMDHGVAEERLQLLACGRRLATDEPRGQVARALNRRVELQLVAHASDGLSQQARCDAVETH